MQLPRMASNPLKMGLPKRVPSLYTQVEAKCKDMGGTKPIHRYNITLNLHVFTLPCSPSHP